ncbi:ABC transporter permease [Acuticoccus sp. MNP-M23]|uniref:ABC transporter permease n=1 Tax=Acuticoccus sp. MNP-M23 TaxID=3072793 RepID=UPI0028162023|nr:ABC transporter permease [Acuticoccus sp. MNP-M23]WMS42574.1 ABC transporter permease [Acuticoccus sp. MNP-M23]
MSDTAIPRRRNPFGRIAGIARRSPTGAIGFAIIALFALAAALAPWITPYNPIEAFPRQILAEPGATFWFGTDGNGMDIFSRVIYGARYAFAIAVPAVLLSMLIGVPLGLWVGYVGGTLDEATMRIFDALRVFPSIILALAVVAAAGPSVLNVVLVIGVLDSPIFARVVRSEVLALRSSTMVEAARAAGNPTWRIVLVHLLPNTMQGAMAQSAVRAAWAVRISAALAFLGVGIQVPTPEWGVMIRQGAEFMVTGQWWVALFPGLGLMLMMLGLNMLGDGAQDLLNPRRVK